MQNTKLLSVSDLNIQFQSEKKSHIAVENISFEINKGKVLGIVGESGSGKSVTALSILGLLPKDAATINSGKIIFHGSNSDVDLLKLSDKQLQKYRGKDISMIFQEPMTSLNPVHKCGRQVKEIIEIHDIFHRKDAKDKTLKLFKEVNLPRPNDIYHSYPHQLSGGQKQRVMIAMAIACNPKLLIADEPTTALDVTIQKTILELLKQLQDKYNMSILFISHDLGVVRQIADHIVVMHQGKIVEQGNVNNIYNHPQDAYTKGLLACRPNLKMKYERLPTISDFINGKSNTDNQVITINNTNYQQSLVNGQSDHVILSVSNLKTYFPSKSSFFGKILKYTKAVDDVSFEIYPGETLGLVGESGCGKTTLGRTIIKLVKVSYGEVYYIGNMISMMSQHDFRKYRKEMQIIFQDPYSSLNPRLTIGSAIIEPMKVHRIGNSKEHRFKSMELLAKVGIEESYYYRYPHELSGGQRQRVCIARALAVNPKFIICDESVSALDVSIQAQVLNLLNDLKKEFGLTYIFISHDLSVVKHMSDRIIVMKDGKIVEMGNAEEIYAKPNSEYTKHLIEAIPEI
ncbi:ABC transporter ATP-binding protein [candidate division KSB1 bacterium]